MGARLGPARSGPKNFERQAPLASSNGIVKIAEATLYSNLQWLLNKF
jgi:hypothetical protein